ncbi:MAG: homospermidine synthase [Elusimicrobia bacterium GWC2_51_8]|nr:MAG: homospermidine synthase [Elusimicrobia bacterium GWA2_51_34]OGR61072.1 MAG: homospermidine synthase [Elusimicrobia bacterium GWC2_51_8]OGR85336.1 MAG: homospermidine synthase [Elusimicrobia bacterium GWF2_52_66]HAF95722.1 homospermidine synthase [Elusimicrobiota bacterium]HCE97044.1 homospermidine synthase [Elusimicrobiota bacterium]
MTDFKNKILFVGYGAVAQCTLPILLKYLKLPAKNITIMDFQDRSAAIREWTSKGVSFVHDRVTRENLDTLLSRHLSAGDVLIDLAWNIDCCEILQWCHDRGVLYVNTSTEIWDPYEGAANKHPTELTLYWRHMNLRKMTAKWPKGGPTAVIEHGANPGLISHFTKQGLIDIGERLITDKKVKGRDAEDIRQLIDQQSFNNLARRLGVKVIHVSERDTQITDRPKQVNEFVNTWCVEGFREEGITVAEMGWGTHEKELPEFAYEHKEGPRNQICLARMGINTWVNSWVPNYCINAMIVRHGEAFTLSDKLTVWENGKAVYRPTVHYAYCPCDCAIASLNELRGYDYNLQPNIRIMTDEIISGSDILGALLMGHDYNAWWTGSDLSIEESRRLVPHQNATTMQVAVSVVAAVLWMMENPDRGVCVPDDLPHEFVLKIAKPYLGKFISTPSDWTPLKHYSNAFLGHNNPAIDRSDPWQFKNFLITDGD